MQHLYAVLRFIARSNVGLYLKWVSMVTLLCLLITQRAYSQCPTAAVSLTSQAQVDAFPSGCTNLTVSMTISGTDITSLSALSGLQQIGGDLYIQENSALPNLDGLSSLTSVGSGLFIYSNGSLTSVSGLGGLQQIELLIIESNSALPNLDGLSSLTSVNSNLSISTNGSLTSLSGLSGLKQSGGIFSIQDNAVLPNLDGLSSLTSVNSNLSISFNGSLTSLSGLNGLKQIGGSFSIQYNMALTNLDGLSSLTRVGSFLSIRNNTQLNTCAVDWLCNLLQLVSNATISDNAAGCNSKAEVQVLCNKLSLAPSPATVCPGSLVTFTATVGNVTGTYDFTLTNGISTTTGSTSSVPFSQTWTADGFGAQSFKLTISANGTLIAGFTSLTVGGVGSNPAINYWTGCASTDWQTAGNWSKGHVPTTSEDVVILVTATNQPVLNEAGAANSVEIPANTTLTIGGSGTLVVMGSRSINSINTGFRNDGLVNNSGRLSLLESTPLTGNQAIRNHGAFNNLTGASIIIDRSGDVAFVNASGASFANSGSLLVGVTVGRSNGFFNESQATNQSGGYISIDRTSSRGFFNTNGSSFTNSSTLLIGSITSGASQGIENQASFSNLAGGLIRIDRLNSTANGIAHTSGSFVNSGTISIGSSDTVGQQGIGSGASFSNTAGGLITINGTSFAGLGNSSTFVNGGTVTIGASSSVGYYSLYNASSGSGILSNLPCGVFNAYEAIYNSVSLVNQGLMVVSTTATHQNTTGFTNQGVISYLLGNPIPNVTNAGIIALPITLCGQSTYSLVLEISGSNTLTVGSTWFTDAQQTNVAGSYSGSGNAFSPNLPGGTTSTLWFPVTDAANSCGLSVPLSVTVKATPSLTVTAAPSLTITEGNTLTLTASGADSYTWTGGSTGSSLTATPATTTVYSIKGTNASSGCTSVTSVTVTVNAIGCNAIIYVTESGTGLQDGSSWANALPGTSLQLAIDRASACGGGQVWVAAGTYKPTTTTGLDSRAISFSMANNVAIYGGFLGSETALSGRPAVNPVTGQPSSSTLSGDIGTVVDNTDNSFNLFVNISLNSTAILDGFVLTGANNDGGYYAGGAIYNENCSTQIRNCLFADNSTIGPGAAISIYNELANPTLPAITNCVFRNNTAREGGAIWYLTAGTSQTATAALSLSNCILQNNVATDEGGAISTRGTRVFLDVMNSQFIGNSAQTGGAIWGLSQQDNSQCRLTLTNTLFQSNSALTGGAVHSSAIFAGTTTAMLTNCAFLNNTATSQGGGVFNEAGQNGLILATLTNCSFQGNQAAVGPAISSTGVNKPSSMTLNNSILVNNGATPALSASNFTIVANNSLFEPTAYALPGFVTGPGNLTTTVSPYASTTGLELAPCSPAIDRGDNALFTAATAGLPTSLTIDLAGNARFFNNGTVDMGAYEFQGEGQPSSFSVLGSGTATCAASPTITLSGSETGVSYQLQRNGTNTGAARPGTGLALSFGPQSLSGTYTVLATSTGGCTALMGTSATVVSNTSSPALSLTPTSATLTCNSPTVSLSAIGDGTVRWSTGESTTVISVSAAGTYTVSLTNTNGCTATASVVVSGTVLRTATVTTDGPVGCGRSSAQITIQATGADSFTLLGAGGYSVTNTSGVFSVTAGGSYTGLAGQSEGCVLSGEVTVGSGGIPPTAVNFRASGALGAGSCTVQLLATVTGDRYVVTGPSGYVFSNVYRTVGTRELVGFTVGKPGTYTLTVYSGSCSATYTTTVTGTACP